MRRQPMFMWYRHRHRQREHNIRTAFNLKFNDAHYAIATPEFWNAWRADTHRTLRQQYAPAKYPAAHLGLPGKKPVWVVFVSRAAKQAFEANHAAPEVSPEAENGDGPIQGLAWVSTRANTGMFLDDRHSTYRSQRSPVVAWLNCNHGRYAVNVVHSAFKLTRPIPAAITDLGDAVDWVYNNAVWVKP